MGHSAVVTGAGRGIGRAIAEQLVRRGYDVVVTDLDADAARRTAEEVGAVAGVGHDVRDEESHAEVARLATTHGPLKVWVNNAGVGDDGTLAELSSESVHRLRPGQPARAGLRHACRARRLRRRRGRRRQHRLPVRPRPGARAQRLRRHQGRRGLADHLGRRGDAAQRAGARGLPRRRRHRDGRGDEGRRPGPRAGALRRRAARPPTRSPPRRSPSSAAAAWSARCPAGAGDWCAPPRSRRRSR